MSNRAVMIRSGGVGDFVLALPLLAALRAHHTGVSLISRRDYLDLIQDDRLADTLIDLDGPVFGSLFTAATPYLKSIISGARVYTFLPDADGSLAERLTNVGAREVVQLNSRPDEPPHTVEQMFKAAGLPIPYQWQEYSPLVGAQHLSGRSLWVHPGSGSAEKNAPPAWFLRHIRAAIPPVVLSFGEADLELETTYRELLADIDCEYVVMPSLFELRQQMAAQAASFIGNDTGITHLAAALGIPTTAVFVSTAPAIWHPIGPHVDVMQV